MIFCVEHQINNCRQCKAEGQFVYTYVGETADTYTLQDSGERQEFETGAVRDTQVGKGRFDLLPMYALWQLAKHYEAGCQKYGDRNWEKGIPLSRYFDSAMRHMVKYMMGYRDEPHMVAAAWNMMCAIETEHRIEEGILPETLRD